MLTKPIGQVAAADSAGGEIEHEPFLFLYGSVDLGTVQD
jgi:hypothetical protein